MVGLVGVVATLVAGVVRGLVSLVLVILTCSKVPVFQVSLMTCFRPTKQTFAWNRW